MKRMFLGSCLQSLLFLFCCCTILTVSSSENCTDSGVMYTNQPPTSLSCNPYTNMVIAFRCKGDFDDVVNDMGINWYRTLGPQQTLEKIQTDGTFSVSSIGIGQGRRSDLSFTLTNETYGYYWCSINGYSNPSTVVPVCPQYINTSAPACSSSAMFIEEEECAIDGSERLTPNITSDCVPVQATRTSKYYTSTISRTESSANISSTTSTSMYYSLTTSSTESIIINSTTSTSTSMYYSSTTSSTESSITSVFNNSTTTATSVSAFPSSSTTIASINTSTVGTVDSTSMSPSSSPSLMETVSVRSSSSSLTDSTDVPESSSTNEPVSVVLIALIAVCVVLCCVALMIVIAISMLCYVTRKGSPKDGYDINKPPTDNQISNGEFYSMISSNNQNGHSISSPSDQPAIVGNDIDHKQQLSPSAKEHAVSFSNPVYEMGLQTTPTATPITSQQTQAVPKPIGVTSSPTPPIFTTSDDKSSMEYAKPDLSKKRARSASASSSQEKTTSPPYQPAAVSKQTNIDEAQYDIPTVIQKKKPTTNNGKSSLEGTTEVGGKVPFIASEYSYVAAEADYDDPDVINNGSITAAGVPAQYSVPFESNDPNYNDPWETLPSAIKRSRESTRSHSSQPSANNGGGVIPPPPPAHPAPGNKNNNNTSLLFDDPAYDVPIL